ncbi:MAG: hypothetical protein K0S21_2648, partial [Rhizobiaceae bacterium]|nr:hypothetical protein [Rhizobiaceae bacterium]
TRPSPDHHSFNEHDAVVEAILDRDGDMAERAMRAHIDTVRRKMMEGSRQGLM